MDARLLMSDWEPVFMTADVEVRFYEKNINAFVNAHYSFIGGCRLCFGCDKSLLQLLLSLLWLFLSSILIKVELP